jgi:hypothetical protein
MLAYPCEKGKHYEKLGHVGGAVCLGVASEGYCCILVNTRRGDIFESFGYR